MVLKRAAKLCKTFRNKSRTESTVKEVTVFRDTNFLNKALQKI